MRNRKFWLGTALAALGAPLLLAAADLAVPQRSELNRPWPYFTAEEPDEPPVRSPADALKSFAMPPGYAVELVAAEPLVQDPILIEFDGDGRLWVMELPGWAHNLSMENSLAPVNRLVVLDDSNNDGIFDKRTVFADNLVLPRAFKVLAPGASGTCALIGEPPTLWKACDTDGDLKADTKEKLADGFARLGVLEHGANGLYWGMDNLIVVSEHEWNVAYKAGQFVTVPGLRRGQWGVTQDDAGRIYRNVNTDPLFVDHVSPRYFARNPEMVRTRGLYENLVEQEKTNIWPAHPTFGLNRGYRREVFREDGSASYYGGVSSPLIYRGTRLPAEVQGMPFVADGATNIVHLLRLKNDGQGRLSAEDYYSKGEFLASTDVRFRPTALAGGPDGTIYIADMYRGVSQDGPLQTDYLRDYINKRQLARGTGNGRIYRVVHLGNGPMARDPRPHMSTDSTATLVGHLSNPNGWWRDTAQQYLVQRADKAAVPLLEKLAKNAKADWRSRLHALWTLDGMGAMTPALPRLAMADAKAELRAAGLRLAEPWLASGDRKLTTAALALASDANWQVRVQAAASLGALPAEQRTIALTTMLALNGDDPVLADAAVSGLKGSEMTVLTALAGREGAPREAMAMLAGALAARRDAATGQALVAMASTDGLPAASRGAIMDGLALGLSGGVQSAGNAVAGGRAGGNIPGVTRQRGGGNRLELAAEPGSLTRLASGKDALAEPAKKLLTLVTWPGRPAPPALPPRSAAEEALFQRGQAIYVEQCSGCHQLQGQGQASIAPPLAGSRRATASGDVPVRILTNGLEGTIGLMPPLGSAMSDEEVAAVLTYVRQSWGNTGAPLPPAAVKEWRLAFAHRTTPWSEKDIDAPQR